MLPPRKVSVSIGLLNCFRVFRSPCKVQEDCHIRGSQDRARASSRNAKVLLNSRIAHRQRALLGAASPAGAVSSFKESPTIPRRHHEGIGRRLTWRGPRSNRALPRPRTGKGSSSRGPTRAAKTTRGERRVLPATGQPQLAAVLQGDARGGQRKRPGYRRPWTFIHREAGPTPPPCPRRLRNRPGSGRRRTGRRSPPGRGRSPARPPARPERVGRPAGHERREEAAVPGALRRVAVDHLDVAGRADCPLRDCSSMRRTRTDIRSSSCNRRPASGTVSWLGACSSPRKPMRST